MNIENKEEIIQYIIIYYSNFLTRISRHIDLLLSELDKLLDISELLYNCLLRIDNSVKNNLHIIFDDFIDNDITLVLNDTKFLLEYFRNTIVTYKMEEEEFELYKENYKNLNENKFILLTIFDNLIRILKIQIERRSENIMMSGTRIERMMTGTRRESYLSSYNDNINEEEPIIEFE